MAVQIKLNRAGVGQLLQSNECLQMCAKIANNAVNRLGDGYEVTLKEHGKTRVNAQIEAVSPRAKKENSENNTILKALR